MNGFLEKTRNDVVAFLREIPQEISISREFLINWGIRVAYLAIAACLSLKFESILSANLSEGHSYNSVIGEIADELGITYYLSLIPNPIKELLFQSIEGLLLLLATVLGRKRFPVLSRYTMFAFGVWVLYKLPLNISDDDLLKLAFTVAGIIGTLIAIIFSFSAFILKTTSVLLSPEYSRVLAQESKGKNIFWVLVSLSLASCFIPFIPESIPFIPKSFLLALGTPAPLLIILLAAFFAVFEMYAELRSHLVLQDVLGKIKKSIFKEMGCQFKILAKSFHSDNKDLGEEKITARFDYGMSHIDSLHEVAIAFSEKNEPRNCNLILDCIRDFWSKLLDLEERYFGNGKKEGRQVAPPYSTKFLSNICACLSSMGDYFIKERKRDSIFCLFKIYGHALPRTLKSNEYIGHEYFYIIFIDYQNFVKRLILTEEVSWGSTAIWSYNNLFNDVLRLRTSTRPYKSTVLLLSSKLSYIAEKISDSDSEFQNHYLTALAEGYLNRIKLFWNFNPSDIFWAVPLNEFNELKKCLLSPKTGVNYIILREAFIKFHGWQNKTLSPILMAGPENQEEKFFSAVFLLNELGNVYKEISSQQGLSTEQGLLSIKSINVNLSLIHKTKQKRENLHDTYKDHLNALDFYFHEDAGESEVRLKNMNLALKGLQKAIRYNLKHEFYDVHHLIVQYVKLEEKFFERAPDSRSRVIRDLAILEKFMEKYERPAEKSIIHAKIEELESNSPNQS